jgi:hypothetical protein
VLEKSREVRDVEREGGKGKVFNKDRLVQREREVGKII